jgi:putative peptide zinc metalloprotease protein
MEMPEGIYAVAEGVESLELDTSLPHKPLLVVVRERHLQVGGLAKDVLLCVKHAPSKAAEIRERLLVNTGTTITEERVHEALRALTDSAILETLDQPEREHPQNERKKSGAGEYFIFKVPLLTEKTLRPITSRLASLFHPRLMIYLLPAMFAAQMLLWPLFFSGFRSLVGSLRGWDYVLLLVGNYLGLVLHELGHASACASFGARHGPIGFGIYLIFPAFYTDVTAAWRLPRLRRIVVDAGGIYLNLISATVAALLYFLTHQAVFAALVGIYDVVVWFSLWPFVRLDGYWLIGDVLGVPNLMSANRELTKWLGRKIFGMKSPRPHILSIEPPWLRPLYFTYYALFLVSVCGMIYILSRLYVPFLVKSLPAILRIAIAEVHRHGMSLTFLKLLLGILFMLVPVLGLSLHFLRAGKRVLLGLSRWFLVHSYSSSRARLGDHTSGLG